MSSLPDSALDQEDLKIIRKWDRIVNQKKRKQFFARRVQDKVFKEKVEPNSMSRFRKLNHITEHENKRIRCSVRSQNKIHGASNEIKEAEIAIPQPAYHFTGKTKVKAHLTLHANEPTRKVAKMMNGANRRVSDVTSFEIFDDDRAGVRYGTTKPLSALKELNVKVPKKARHRKRPLGKAAKLEAFKELLTQASTEAEVQKWARDFMSKADNATVEYMKKNNFFAIVQDAKDRIRTKPKAKPSRRQSAPDRLQHLAPKVVRPAPHNFYGKKTFAKMAKDAGDTITWRDHNKENASPRIAASTPAPKQPTVSNAVVPVEKKRSKSVATGNGWATVVRRSSVPDAIKSLRNMIKQEKRRVSKYPSKAYYAFKQQLNAATSENEVTEIAHDFMSKDQAIVDYAKKSNFHQAVQDARDAIKGTSQRQTKKDESEATKKAKNKSPSAKFNTFKKSLSKLSSSDAVTEMARDFISHSNPATIDYAHKHDFHALVLQTRDEVAAAASSAKSPVIATPQQEEVREPLWQAIAVAKRVAEARALQEARERAEADIFASFQQTAQPTTGRKMKKVIDTSPLMEAAQFNPAPKIPATKQAKPDVVAEKVKPTVISMKHKSQAVHDNPASDFGIFKKRLSKAKNEEKVGSICREFMNSNNATIEYAKSKDFFEVINEAKERVKNGSEDSGKRKQRKSSKPGQAFDNTKNVASTTEKRSVVPKTYFSVTNKRSITGQAI